MDIIKQEVVLTILYKTKPISQAHNVNQKLIKKYGKDYVRIKNHGASKLNYKVGKLHAFINLDVFIKNISPKTN